MVRKLYFLHSVQNASVAHPASCPVGIREFSSRIKRPGLEADQSSPSGAEVKKAWSYNFILTYVFTCSA
jgi:hypothetical protein